MKTSRRLDRRFRPSILVLESRALLSTVVPVTNGNPSGSGSWAAALTAAAMVQGPVTIRFVGTYSVQQTIPAIPVIPNDVESVIGDGSIIKSSRTVLEVPQGANVTISGLHMVDTGPSVAVLNNGTLVLDNLSTVTGATAVGDMGGSLTVENSTLWGTTASLVVSLNPTNSLDIVKSIFDGAAIVETTPGNSMPANVDIFGLTMTGAGPVGLSITNPPPSPGAAPAPAVANVELTGAVTGPGLFVNVSGAATLSGGFVTTYDGELDLSAGGNISVTEPITADGGNVDVESGGNLTFNTGGASLQTGGGPVLFSGKNISFNTGAGVINTTGGTMSVEAEGTLTLVTAAISTGGGALVITAAGTSGSLTINSVGNIGTAGGSIDIDGGWNVNIDTSGNISTAGGNIVIEAANNIVIYAEEINAGDGDLDITAGNNITIIT